jgi:3-isopropylmalate/(R)-2-methylmalate dehydratase large subunit
VDRQDGADVSGRTIAERILSAKSGGDARAGDVVVAAVDLVIGTDASTPMAIGYFERMGGTRLFDPSRVVFALDHYSPPASPKTAAYHQQIRAFARRHGATCFEVGDGISHQIVAERGLARPGDLIVGADSHTVTLGALNAFAIGLGSSDLAAAMMTGEVWLRVPATRKVVLTGERPRGLSPKDVALGLLGGLGLDGASYQAIEFHGPALAAFSLDDRLVLSNLMVEADAKAAIFAVDGATRAYLHDRLGRPPEPVEPDRDAAYVAETAVDISALEPVVAMPHAPDRVQRIGDVAGAPIHMVFIGTCTGGRTVDVHEALAVLERAGGRIAPGVQLVITPASRDVHLALIADGSLRRLVEMGAIVTTPGCGACCGTSGVIPSDGMTVMSTANRNFKARMGNATASIVLASPAACAAAAATGCITDPRAVGGPDAA